MSEIHSEIINFDLRIKEATNAAISENNTIVILTYSLQQKQDSLQEEYFLSNIKVEKSIAIVKQSFHEIALFERLFVTTKVINSLSNNKAAIKEYLNGSQNTKEAQHRLKTMVLKETAV